MSSKKIVDLRGKQSGFRFPAPAPREKRETLRARRRRARIIIGVLLFFVLCGWVYALHWLSYRPQYQISSIQVENASHVPEAQIIQYVDSRINSDSQNFLSPSNIFFYPRVQIEKDLVQHFPRILTARLSRASAMSQTLTVTVVERKPFALWCGGSQCYQMDESGFLFAGNDVATSSATSPYVFYGPLPTSTPPIGQTYGGGMLLTMLDLMRLLAQSGSTPRSATVENESDYTVALPEGYSIKASFNEDPTMLLKNLKLVLDSSALRDKTSDLEYVDLRFGDRVYYKMKNANAVVSQ